MIATLPATYIQGLEILDESFEYLQNASTVAEGLDLLHEGLKNKREAWNPEKWQTFCNDVCLSHPIREMLHQDPITYRSFSKPRGYAGDAVLLDYLYRHPAVVDDLRNATDLGRAICEYKVSCPSAESVRWRRQLLARLIDETAERVADAEILSVACGHLREAAMSHAVRWNGIKRLVALDQDGESLAAVQCDRNGSRIHCVQASVKELIRGNLQLGKFDFIYAAGLYDYLNDSASRLLSRSLFKMLKKDGRLLVANFLRGNQESGYMEAFMGWELLYRTKEEFEDATGILRNELGRLFFDDNRSVVYLEFRKY